MQRTRKTGAVGLEGHGKWCLARRLTWDGRVGTVACSPAVTSVRGNTGGDDTNGGRNRNNPGDEAHVV